MYRFDVTYLNMEDDTTRTKVIQFDYDFSTEKEAYMYAMSKAYDEKKYNECFNDLMFIYS